MKENKGALILTIGLLGLGLAILGIGTTQPRKYTEGMTLCSDNKVGDVGFIQGIITDKTKSYGRLSLQIKEGTQGCTGLLTTDVSNFVNLDVGNRIKGKVKIVADGMYELIGEAQLDPTVVDENGETEDINTIKVRINTRPKFYVGAKYAGFSINRKDGFLNLKIKEAIADQIRIGEIATIYYYSSTKEIKEIKYE